MRVVYCQWRARQPEDFFLSSRSVVIVSALAGIPMAAGLAADT
ncbi:MAG: hypothetical protein ACYTGZ_14600 [Planctomycetota bacterium]|jgi:hypothetical protein